MPRLTRPSARHQHSRASVRFQRYRIANKRWRQLKDRSTDWHLRFEGRQFPLPFFIHPEEAHYYADSPAIPLYYLFAAGKNSNRLNRNPWTLCSCAVCQGEWDSSPRSRERHQWLKEAADESSNWKDDLPG
jgi:hypothetical protein